MAGRRAAAAMVIALGLAGAGVTTAASAAEPVPELPADLAAADACRQLFGAGAFQGFLPTRNAASGERVVLDVTWPQREFSDGEEVELIGCVSRDGDLVPRLAIRTEGLDNDGQHRRAFVLPSDAEPGTVICHRGAVVGTGPAGGPHLFKTRPACLEVVEAGAVTEEALPAGAGEAQPTEVQGPPAPEVAGRTEARDAPAAAPERPAAAAPATAAEAAAPEGLPRTGPAHRGLLFAAGLLVCLGGLAVMFGARRTAVPAMS